MRIMENGPSSAARQWQPGTNRIRCRLIDVSTRLSRRLSHMKHALRCSTVTLATTLALIVASEMPVNAQRLHYPWCSRYFNSGGPESCAFNTHSQCMQTVNG